MTLYVIIYTRGDPMEFVEKLKKLRTKRKLSQQEIATAIGIKRTTYTSYERGQNEPSLDMIRTFAIFFGVSADYLLGIEKTANQTDILYKQLQDLSSSDKMTVQKILSALADKTKEQAQ